MTLGIKLNERISTFSNSIALSSDDKKISYSQLNEHALKIAAWIGENNLEKEPVGIVGQRNFASYYGILGSIYAGCTYVPINVKYTTDTMRKIISEARIKILIGSIESLNPISELIDNLRIHAVILPDDILDEQKLCIKSKIVDRNELTSIKASCPIVLDGAQILYMLFTSGTTGSPKGVMVSHNNVDEFISNTSSFYKLSFGYRASQTFDLSFDASVVDIFYTWFTGGQLCLLNQAELLMPYDYIRREQLSFWYSVPTLANMMLKMGFLVPNSFPDLKYSLFGGEPLPKKLADAWQLAAPNSTVENVYGPTEATVNITRFHYKKTFKERSFKNDILSIGTTFNNHDFAILDPDLKRVKEGEVGQLAFSGKQISHGYQNDKKKTDSVFKPMSWDENNKIWYLTGDLAFVNSYQEIECLGRIDNQIKIGGRRIELGEIENALMKTKLLRDVVVVPKRDSSGGVISLLAFTTENLPGKKLNTVLVKSTQFIEKIFLPKKIIILEAMPLMSSGKTDRKKLGEIAQKETF